MPIKSRRDFLKVCSLLGIAVPTQVLSVACGGGGSDSSGESSSDFSGKVLIVGAGAAGLASGYLLAQRNIEFEILEASSSYGGRMKHDLTFADFPIPLGAEWLHADESELDAIVNDQTISVDTTLQSYSADDDIESYDGSTLSTEKLGSFSDLKFVNSSWLDFYEEFITPSLAGKITFDIEIKSIDYSGDQVSLVDQNNQVYLADKVIFTVPLQRLKDDQVSFTPELPSDKQQAIAQADVWSGIKVFIEFSEKFYTTFLSFNDSDTTSGQREYYDAAYGQNTSRNVLGLFAVGEQAQPYQNRQGDDLIDYILAELDEVYGGRATSTYVKHLSQNWGEAPFIQSAYLSDHSSTLIPLTLGTPVSGKLFFAGEAYAREEDWGAVHNAARSAKEAVDEVLSS